MSDRGSRVLGLSEGFGSAFRIWGSVVLRFHALLQELKLGISEKCGNL